MQQISKRFSFSYDLNTLKGDVFGGVTAGVVGLPVALAFGVASGVGAAAGMYGAIAVGFFAAVFGGTRSLISGPTGPMSVAMAAIVTIYADSITHAFAIVILAGLIQMLLGLVRIGRYVAYTPYSVISGFMSAIGIIIIVMQTIPFMGVEAVSGGPVGAIKAWPDAIGEFNLSAFFIAAVTLAVGVLWPKRLAGYVPSTLMALLAGTALGVLWLTDAPVIGEIPTALPQIINPNFTVDFLVSAAEPALVIALLGSIDSLLTSLIAESITREPHKPNRELVGQGIGNIVSGLIGGLPGAGATPNTMVNLRAGGRTQLSGVICALILLALVLGAGRLAEAIPIAVLAGILVKVGWDIIDWRFITRAHRIEREHLFVMIATLGLAVFLDLVTAVAIGLIVAGMASAKVLERLELDNVVSVPLLDRIFFAGKFDDAEDDDEFSARVGMVALRGSFTVSSSHSLIVTITEDIRDHEVVILDFTDTLYMDDSAAHVVEQMIDSAIAEKTETIVMGLGGRPETTLLALGSLDKVPLEQFVADQEEAADVAYRLLFGHSQYIPESDF